MFPPADSSEGTNMSRMPDSPANVQAKRAEVGLIDAR
jgi:hypothetical protein